MNNLFSNLANLRLEEYRKQYFKYALIPEDFNPKDLYEDFLKIKRGEGDSFFQKYGVGNKIFETMQPRERFKCYESLLYLLYSYNKEKYLTIHKGIPYFYLSWTAFQCNDFEKALFYMDCAISEDIKRMDKDDLSKSFSTPAIDFILLNRESDTVAQLMHQQMYFVINDLLTTFREESGVDINIQNFISKFIKPYLFDLDKQKRSIITALYSFILESGTYNLMVSLRSEQGGSIEPFVNHLFKGARILESVLRQIKGQKKQKGLDKIILNLQVLELKLDYFKKTGNATLARAINKYHSLKDKKESFQTCNFSVSSLIRNSTGHSLVWEDIFQKEENYVILHNSVKNSILWAIYKLYISI